MLAIEPYVGLRDGGSLVAVAGLHVFSPTYRVAALGNIAVRASHRGRGLGGRVTGALCRRLRDRVDTVALNVAADNAAARACYERLGFAVVAEYDEVELFRGRLV
jgi:predicted GNAT family acetyltransferase